MFCYVAYGLNIHSVLPLPELLASKTTTEADVVIRFGSVERFFSETTTIQGCFQATQSEAWLFYEEAGVFLVREGREIIVDSIPDVEQQVLRLFILGVSLGILLHQRGRMVLHASAFVVDGSAVAFVGDSGQGKSTTAAAFHAHGYQIISDDILALDMGSSGSPIAFPAFPRLKLCPRAAVSLGHNLETLSSFHPEDERRDYRIANEFCQIPLPLQCIYVLDQGSQQQVEALGLQETFVELVHHSYALRFLGAIGVNAAHFHQCMRLASSVPIYRLKRQRSLNELPEIVQLVEKHLASATSQPRQESLI